jgi:hypothetical protein
MGIRFLQIKGNDAAPIPDPYVLLAVIVPSKIVRCVIEEEPKPVPIPELEASLLAVIFPLKIVRFSICAIAAS